ncbi:MAG: hypothetical protein P8J27_01210 [Mariniblastus sp.]|nr:hypothetical protein [Mariniblastus sp.]
MSLNNIAYRDLIIAVVSGDIEVTMNLACTQEMIIAMTEQLSR